MYININNIEEYKHLIKYDSIDEICIQWENFISTFCFWKIIKSVFEFYYSIEIDNYNA